MQLYLISIISPTTEFHFAVLVIEWEPRDVYLACALEDTRGHVQTTAVMFDHNVGVIRAIKSLIRTKLQLYIWFLFIRFFSKFIFIFLLLSFIILSFSKLLTFFQVIFVRFCRGFALRFE